MKIAAALFIVSLAAPAFALPSTTADLKLSGEERFMSVPPVAPIQIEPAKPQAPIVQNTQIKILHAQDALGPLLGQVNLANQLDRHRNLLLLKLGDSDWNIGAAGDAAFQTAFLTFTQGQKLVISPALDLDRLRNEGIDIALEPGLTYHFHATLHMFASDPVRESTLEITPAQGTAGPSYTIDIGTIIDAVKAKSYVFNTAQNEYWMLYSTNIDPATAQPTDTRSVVFIHYAGTDSKAWPVGDSALTVGSPAAVSFGDDNVVLERTADGELQIYAGQNNK